MKSHGLTPLNTFSLEVHLVQYSFLESVLSKWPVGRNPEVSRGSESVLWERYVIVTNA